MKNDLKVLAMYKKMEAASKDLERVIYEEYPVGCIVQVKRGTYSNECEIASHTHCWWSSPGDMRVRNRKTGKLKRITFTQIFTDHDWKI